MSEVAVWMRTEAERARLFAAEDLKIAVSCEEEAARKRASAANWQRKAGEMLRAAKLVEQSDRAETGEIRDERYVIRACGAPLGADVCVLQPGHERSHLSRSGRQW